MDKGGALPGQPRAPTAASDSPPVSTAAGAESSPVYQSGRVKEMASVEPIDVMWEHVSLRVPVKGSKTKKAVLLDVSGKVQHGQVSAIMGASGCGKTSLLNVLAGRVQAVKGGELNGRLLTNNKVREEGEFRKLAGYVTQDDTLYACLTVQETLMLAAFFKLGKKLGPGKALEDYVTGVINDLGLKKCRNTAIGDAMIKGVSGGERKRVSIGVEMISNPSVLFLDEPTSGLDSFQALAVMSALKELAGTQRTIVTVIHQPRSSIFAMLDRLVLLSEGRTIYVGPAADAPLYFHRQGFTCPAHSSPADYLLDVVAKDFRTSKLEALSQQRIDVLTQAYEEHCRTEQVALVPALGDGKEKELVVVSSVAEVRRIVSDDGASYGAGWWTQVRFLAWRNVMVASRNKIGRIVSLALPTFFGLLFGAIWSNRNTDPQKAIQDRIGLMFMATILMGFMGMSETLQTFPIEKRTVQKERASGFYSLSAYYAAKVVTNVPFAIAGPMLFCCIVYPAADMRAGFEHFLVWLAVIIAQVVAAGSLGMFLSSIASDPEIANAMAPAFNIIFTVFNGVLINVNDLPSGTKWLAIIGYNRWAFEALAINEFRDRPYSCGSAVNPGTCVTNGDQILKLYTYDQGTVGFCFLWMVVICLVVHFLAYFNLWRNATTYLKMRSPAAKPLPAPVLGEASAAAAAAANGKAETSLTVRAIPPSKEEEEEALEEVNERGGGAANMAPVPAVNVSWQHVTLKVSGGKARPPKVVLDNVNGEVRTGTLTAIMGPTGSGKSSLLMVLAGRVVQAKGMELTGTLLTNKIPRDPASFRNISAFVTQDDLLFGHLTVSETLVLAAHFALGSSITPAEKAKLVTSIVDEMGLAKTLHTIIGDDRARGVSGGERKRVSIGVELISNPSVLFLDEPTSGLDSFQAQSVMAALKKLAGTQRTIVAVIHQPRSSIFTMFDELILISEGRTIFIGPAEKAARHFAAQGFVCPPQYNAADLFLDSISMDYRTEALEHVTRARIAQLADTWRDHPYPDDDDDEASDAGLDAPALVRGPSCKDLAAASYISPQDRGGWFNNLYYLTWRAGKSAYRNNFAIGLRILLNVMFALIFSGIWHDVQNTQTGIQSLVGIIFMCATNVAFTNTQAVINSFPREKGIVQKEQASNAYSLSAYYLSKFFSELPLNVFGPFIFSSMVFWIVHFNHSLVNYGIFLATMCLSALSAIGLGTLISTLAPNTEVAAALSPVFNVLFLLFSGVLINTQSLPAGARWVASISPIKWTVNALALNEFTGATFDCTDGQRCLATGEEVLSLYSWDDATIGHSMLSIVLIMCALLTLGYVVLRLSLPRYIKAEEKEEDNQQQQQQQQPSEKQEAQALAVVS